MATSVMAIHVKAPQLHAKLCQVSHHDSSPSFLVIMLIVIIINHHNMSAEVCQVL